MAYILVALVFIMLVMLVIAGCLLGGQRLFPGRQMMEYFASDGVELHEAVEPALVVSDRITTDELKRLKFATSFGGYNKNEVDQFIAQLIERNETQAPDRSSVSATEVK